MPAPERRYFQLEQAREVASAFARHKVEYLFIGKGGAIILGYPAATQDVDLFPNKTHENGVRLVDALRELKFPLDDATAAKIIAGSDFVQLKDGPFDLDLVFAPDGIESFEAAHKRMHDVEGFPVANIRDIIASKRASGREKDLIDLPLLEDFQEEFEKGLGRGLRSAAELAMEKSRADE